MYGSAESACRLGARIFRRYGVVGASGLATRNVPSSPRGVSMPTYTCPLVAFDCVGWRIGLKPQMGPSGMPSRAARQSRMLSRSSAKRTLARARQSPPRSTETFTGTSS